MGYVLWNLARKHKLVVTFGVLATAIALALLGVWVESRKQMAMQVELSRSLGEDVKSMELYMRAAYELPLHDVENQRDVIRRRLGDIERRMQAAGKAGIGPGHYAKGRGHWAQIKIHTPPTQIAGYD